MPESDNGRNPVANTTPSSFNRRILLAVSGMSPLIPAETLYALTRQHQAAYIP